MQKILLLEDDLNLNRGIALLLSREGYEVRQVYTIKEAKEAFQKGDYALVISDITLPDGTGLDFVYNKNKINIHTFPSYVQGFHRILLQKSINPFLIASL